MSITRKAVVLFGAAAIFVCLAANAFAMKDSYNYMSPVSLQKAIETKADVAIVDIQVADEFKSHHIKGAIETCAYPVKSDVDTKKLDASLNSLKGSDQPIVVICPRGKGGAERTVNYFAKQGIAPYRLFILTNGQDGWPYAVEKN
ncbi:rhodanese-like domain-containing protein [Desulfovibrio sp. JC010]|uniref:rhodanese-like domain-containing protein n=1 Tax=Desulfovibrio sp. JC010 TaxID=2593641 RepID=UPI0013D7D4D7|nr:rhodanese-like domain-containing protein [Desulfovibrio sp. JC010]NDV25739.1 rhodanese-like domain-containing protein [Desulfovibrio sp. JC010]